MITQPRPTREVVPRHLVTGNAADCIRVRVGFVTGGDIGLDEGAEELFGVHRWVLAVTSSSGARRGASRPSSTSSIHHSGQPPAAVGCCSLHITADRGQDGPHMLTFSSLGVGVEALAARARSR
jgi:hypothetical protein